MKTLSIPSDLTSKFTGGGPPLFEDETFKTPLCSIQLDFMVFLVGNFLLLAFLAFKGLLYFFAAIGARAEAAKTNFRSGLLTSELGSHPQGSMCAPITLRDRYANQSMYNANRRVIYLCGAICLSVYSGFDLG